LGFESDDLSLLRPLIRMMSMRRHDRNCAGRRTLKHSYPLPQREVQIPANKQTKVVRHVT